MKKTMLVVTIAAMLLPPVSAAAQMRPARPQVQPTRPGNVGPQPARPDRPQIQPIRPTKPHRPGGHRPGHGYRPGYGHRPGHGYRPGQGHRPGYNRPHHYQFKRIRVRPYHYPHGYHYRLWAVGHILPALFLSSHYYYDGYSHVGHPPHGYRWVRYGPDLLLVDIHTHRIARVETGVFY